MALRPLHLQVVDRIRPDQLEKRERKPMGKAVLKSASRTVFAAVSISLAHIALAEAPGDAPAREE